MYARVTRWEGAEAQAMRSSAEQIKAQASQGPPEGVPAKGFLMLIAPENGRGLGITFFETEEDMRTGDRVMNEMNPPDDAMGKRVSVEGYEVALDVKM